jgi:hypothetical protein
MDAPLRVEVSGGESSRNWGLTINIHQPSGFNGDGVYWVFVGYTMVTLWSFLNVFNGRLRTSGWFFENL